jgi:predicted Zn-dependent protease
MMFSAQKSETADKVFREYLRLYPQSPVPYYFLGRLQMDKKQFDIAYQNLLKAKELNFSFFPIDWDIETCARELTGNITITHKN